MLKHFFTQSKQLLELRQELDTLKREVSGLDLEWSDMHDRLRRMLAKLAKRDERAAQAPEREDTQPAEGEEAARFSSLPPRARLIQSQILARRKLNGGAQ